MSSIFHYLLSRPRVREIRVGYFRLCLLGIASLILQVVTFQQYLLNNIMDNALDINIYPQEEDKASFSWSACLLIKDNNIILPEWLAYHYTVLPLRRLIVAIDPASDTDPSPILHLYESTGMNITIWDEGKYWVNGKRDHEKKDWRITDETPPLYAQDRLVYRQKVFYHACLKQLKKENRTWTTVIDTGKYFAA